MYGTIGWIALLVASLATELNAHVRHTNRATLADFGTKIMARWGGRFALLLLWAFVGIHLFTRYGTSVQR
jgi:hypothetical protein